MFKRAIAKFKKEKKIWLEFFNFLITHKCSNLLNKEIGICLANNPKDLDFWKIAAYNEHENNLNTFVARNIFQKCIRMNKENLYAYLDYFLFEIKFVEKILERKKILAKETEEKKTLKMIDDVDVDANVDVNNNVNVVNNNDNNELVENKNKENKEDDAVLNLKICEIIWHKALKADLLEEFKDNKILTTFEFLRILYKNKSQLEKNAKTLKNKMVDYLLNNNNDLLSYYNTTDLSNAKRLVNIDLFLLKIEKFFSFENNNNNNKDANIANIKVNKIKNNLL